jgi:hypothetical protein
MVVAKGGGLRHLWGALDLKLSELLQVDFFLGLLGGSASLTLALVAPDALLRGVAIAAGLVGVILGAVIAGVSIQAAFFDQAFLRKLRAIGREPVYYLAPFLFTVVIGVAAMLGLLVLAVLTPAAHPAVLGVAGGVTGFAVVWTIASLLPCLATLVQFIGLKMDALDVPDDIDIADGKRAAGRR